MALPHNFNPPFLRWRIFIIGQSIATSIFSIRDKHASAGGTALGNMLFTAPHFPATSTLAV
jgi:hypothetical protein